MVNIWRGSKNGDIQKWMVYKGKIVSKIDDDQGTPIYRTPPTWGFSSPARVSGMVYSMLRNGGLLLGTSSNSSKITFEKKTLQMMNSGERFFLGTSQGWAYHRIQHDISHRADMWDNDSEMTITCMDSFGYHFWDG